MSSLLLALELKATAKVKSVPVVTCSPSLTSLRRKLAKGNERKEIAGKKKRAERSEGEVERRTYLPLSSMVALEFTTMPYPMFLVSSK